MAWSQHLEMLLELRKRATSASSYNIPACLDQAIQTRKP